jgi:hypothetical protein
MINIEKLGDLPYKESFKQQDKGWCSRYWNRGKKYNGKYAWDFVEQILNKYKGKQVNNAFSEYCKIVESYDQYRFWEEFDKLENVRRWRGDDYECNYWFIDKNNNIQYHKVKKEPKEYHIQTADYEEGYEDHMGNIITTEEYYKLSSRAWMDTRWTRAKSQKWKHIVIKGGYYTFKKKDADFYRCLADENGKRDKMQREYEKYAEKKAYSFLTREEEERIKDRDNDIIKRDSHGFDEDSFTNNNGRLND